MNKEKLIQEVIEFIEGKIDIKIFYENYKNGKYDELFDVYLGYETIKFRKKKVSDFLNIFNVNTSRHRVSFFNGVKAYLFYEGYSYVPTKKYEEEWSFRVGIQPSYVLIEDDEILFASYSENDKNRFYDVENMLFYNIIELKMKRFLRSFLTILILTSL